MFTEEEFKKLCDAIMIQNELIGIAKARLFQKQNQFKLVYSRNNEAGTKKEDCVPKKLKRGEGTICKRERINSSGKKNIYWQGRVFIDGKQKTVTAKTQEDCLKRMKELTNNKKSNDVFSSTTNLNKQLKFGKWLDEWFNTYKKPFLKASSLNSLDTCIKLHVFEKLKNTDLNDIKTIDLQQNLNSIKFGRQREIVYRIFCASLKQAHSLELIDKRIWEGLVNKKHKSKTRKILSFEEEKILMEKARPDLARIIQGYLWTGCRRNELLMIRWKDIDFKNKRITIYGTKTEASVRTIPLFKGFIDILGEVGKEDDLVFNLTPERTNKLFLKACREAGIEGITIHSLRHTFASRMMNIYHLSLKEIQTILGHTSIKTTADIYVHIANDFEKNIAEKIDKQYTS